MDQDIPNPASRSKTYIKKRLLFPKKRDSGHETTTSFMNSPEVSPNVVPNYQDDDPSYDNDVPRSTPPILISNHNHSSSEGSNHDQSSAHSSRRYHQMTNNPPSTNHLHRRLFGNRSSSSNRDRSPSSSGRSFNKRFFIDQKRRSSNVSITTAPSIRSAISVGRQTLRSLRMRRINLMLNKQSLPEFETEAYCKHCEKYLQTRVRYRNGSMVWLMAFILLMCTVFLFWVPFYVKYFKDVSHYCPGCGKKLGTYHRI